MIIIDNSKVVDADMGGMVLHNRQSKCSRCYYQGKCGEVNEMEGCEYFDSIEDEEDDDTYIDKIIENGRNQWIEDNKEYMSDWE